MVLILIHCKVQLLDVLVIAQRILVEPCYFLHSKCPFGLLQERLCSDINDECLDHIDSFASKSTLLPLKF